jgi:hypothetical protein
MPHGSMRTPCRKHTHKFLKILKKIECTFVHKKIKTLILVVGVHGGTNLIFLVQPILDPIPWDVRVEGKIKFLVGIDV